MEVHDTLQKVVMASRKRNLKRQNWLSEEALQIAEKRREVKGKGERKDIPI